MITVFFSIWMMSSGRPKLACKQKASHPGRWWIVHLEQSCDNFYPSGTFRSSRRSSNEDGKEGAKVTRRIPLTRGKFTLVDAEDYYRLVKFNWRAVLRIHTIYASTRHAGRLIAMHRIIMDAPDHLVVDHIDHNGLNNCKSNLRLCTIAQNTRNALPNKGTSSRHKGVSWNKGVRKWRATIQYEKKRYGLGDFNNEIDAAKAYDKKAREFFGEFAHLNFPQETG